MKAKLLYLVLGLALGAVVTAAIWIVNTPITPPAPAVDEQLVERLRRDAAEARNRAKLLEQANAELANELAASKMAATTAAPVTPGAPQLPALGSTNVNWRGLVTNLMTNEAVATGVSKMMVNGLKQRLEERLATLKLRLRLTDTQEQQLKSMIDQKLATAGDLTARMIQGKGTPEDQQTLRALYTDAQSEMQRVLTADQWTEYQAYQAEERQTRAESMANAELSRMGRELQLTDTQQEQVYRVLYAQAEKQLIETEAGGPANGDWAQYLQQQNDAKKAALQPVLTPEQLQAYDKIQSSRANWIRMFNPGGGGGFLPGGR